MYELDKRKFGAFVAQLRKEKGWTQKELAERLLISDKAISKWETATTIPDTGLLIPLADILGVTVTELLTGERIDKEPMMPEKVEDIVKTAITYNEAAPTRAWKEKGPWGIVYALCCLLAWGYMPIPALSRRRGDGIRHCQRNSNRNIRSVFLLLCAHEAAGLL